MLATNKLQLKLLIYLGLQHVNKVQLCEQSIVEIIDLSWNETCEQSAIEIIDLFWTEKCKQFHSAI